MIRTPGADIARLQTPHPRAGDDGEAKLRPRRLDEFIGQAALKAVIGFRGVPVREDVRAPLRRLTDGERAELRAWLESS